MQVEFFANRLCGLFDLSFLADGFEFSVEHFGNISTEASEDIDCSVNFRMVHLGSRWAMTD